MDFDAKGFLSRITPKTAPQPVPTAVAKTEPQAKPPAPPEMKPEAKPDKTNFQQRMSDEMDAQVEIERHPEYFQDTDGGWENVQLVLDYVKEHHDGYLSRQTVHDAVTTLQRRGELLTLFKPEPAKPVKQPEPQTQVPQKQAEQAPPVPDPEEGLPPLPPFVVRALGSNKLRNRRDVHAIPTQLYSDLYRGPFAEVFRKRVNAALAR